VRGHGISVALTTADITSAVSDTLLMQICGVLNLTDAKSMVFEISPVPYQQCIVHNGIMIFFNISANLKLNFTVI
jgi:hypothetical protein